MQIDHRDLSIQALEGILESFIHRQDHGIFDESMSIESMKNHLKASLDRKELFLFFDDESESVNLLTAAELKKCEAQGTECL